MIQAEPRLKIRVSGQLDGYLEPCGCAANQLGGLARRTFKLRESDDYDLLLEGGNLIATDTDLDFDKLLLILQVLHDAEHRYDAVGVGRRDLELGSGEDGHLFAELMQGFAQLPAVAADLATTAETADWPIRGFTEKTTEDGITARVTSLTMDAPEDRYRIIPPATAWTTVMRDAPETTYRILMVHATTDAIEALAPKLEPRPDLIVGINLAYNEPPDEPRLVDGIPVVYPGTRGRALLDVWLARTASGASRITRYESMPLSGSKTSPGAASDPDVRQLIRDHRFQVKEAGLREAMADQHPTWNNAEYVGSERCGTCHVAAYKKWQSTPHAQAWATLEKAEGSPKYPWPVTHYPDCVGCHVVGYGQKSGFVSPERTPLLQNVGCEQCHGPGSEHVQRPQKGDFLAQTIDTCTACHNYEQSPKFISEYDAHWKAIEHGK